jgi:hypothetical protein
MKIEPEFAAGVHARVVQQAIQEACEASIEESCFSLTAFIGAYDTLLETDTFPSGGRAILARVANVRDVNGALVDPKDQSIVLYRVTGSVTHDPLYPDPLHPDDVAREADAMEQAFASRRDPKQGWALLAIRTLERYQLVAKVDGRPLAPATDPLRATRAQTRDWTVGDNGRANSSVAFSRIKARIAEIIVNSAHDLLRGNAETVAGLILAQLAHVHGLAPRGAVVPDPTPRVPADRADLVRRLRRLAEDIVEDRLARDSGRGESRAERMAPIVATLRATLAILDGVDPAMPETVIVLKELTAVAETGKLTGLVPDATFVAHLRVAADAIQALLDAPPPSLLAMWEAHDAPLLAPNEP